VGAGLKEGEEKYGNSKNRVSAIPSRAVNLESLILTIFNLPCIHNIQNLANQIIQVKFEKKYIH
jgi:hypothetical protein